MLTRENTCGSGEGPPLIPTMLAKRIPPRVLPPPTTEQQRQGLRYEKKVVRALKARNLTLEHNPWFEYLGGVCCPDIIIYELSQNRVIVVEVKLTYTPEALVKLRTLYCPIVTEVTRLLTSPLLIIRRANNRRIEFQPSLWAVLNSPSPVYLWPGNGPIT